GITFLCLRPLFECLSFPTRRSSDLRRIVMERIDMVGLLGSEGKFPGEISGGMRKRAGLARALVLDPQIILCAEPDSGLDPVRTGSEEHTSELQSRSDLVCRLLLEKK